MDFTDFLNHFEDVDEERPGVLRALCPAHGDTNPSLVMFIHETRVGLHCQSVGCNTADILKAAGLPAGSHRALTGEPPTDYAPQQTSVAELGAGPRAALRKYVEDTANLLNDAALDYVARRFGITPEIAAELELGYDGPDADITTTLGRSRRAYLDVPRVTVPFPDFAGRLHALQGRALADSQVRWSGLSNPEGAAWGRYAAFRNPTNPDTWLVCEGPGDALTAYAAGFSAVAIRGATNTNRQAIEEMRTALAESTVWVVGDNDSAGDGFANGLLAALPGAHRLTVPGHNDLADWYAAAPEKFATELRNATANEGPAAMPEPKPSKKDIDPYALFHQLYDLFRTRDGMVVARRKGDDSRTVTEVGALKGSLMRDIYQRTGQFAPKDKTAAALEMVTYDAAEQEQTDVALRSHYDRHARTIFVDLGTPEGHIVRVTPDGWTVEAPNSTHPLFRRNRTMAELPIPTQPTKADRLREILRMDETDERWRLIRGWLATALFADTPRPLLWCQGPQGSGKTTAAMLVHNVIEPRKSLGAPITKTDDASVVAMNRYLVSFDNVSAVTRAMSDWLCRLVTGAEDEKRELYSNGGTFVMSAMRTGVVTSLSIPVGLQSDAVERIVKVPFQRMNDEQRTTDDAIWAEFHSAHPELLGAVLNDVSAILRHLPTIRERDAAGKLDKKRMAHYHMALMALDIADGKDGADDGVAQTYARTIGESLADRALDDELALAILSVAHGHGGRWEGVVKDLRTEVITAAMEQQADPGAKLPSWVPSSPRRMGAALDECSEALRNAGLSVTRMRRTKAGVPLVLQAERDLSELDLPTYTPSRPQGAECTCEPGDSDLFVKCRKHRP